MKDQKTNGCNDGALSKLPKPPAIRTGGPKKSHVELGTTPEELGTRSDERGTEEVEAYYYRKAATYYVFHRKKNSNGVERVSVDGPLSETNMARELRAVERLSTRIPQGGQSLSQVEKRLRGIQTNFPVAWVGRIAGHPIGYYPKVYDQPILIVEADDRFEAKDDSTDTFIVDAIKRFFGPVQFPHIMNWLHKADQSLIKGAERLLRQERPNFRPGQTNVVGGVIDYGKSLLIAIGFTKILGGRNATPADPHQAQTGASTFNEDVIEKVHHVTDDKGGSDSTSARRSYGDAIKQDVGSTTKRSHPKGKKAMVFEPFSRQSILLNSEVVNLQVLPPQERGLMDKMNIFKAVGEAFPGIDTTDDDVRNGLMDKINASIPAFLGQLRQWVVAKSDPQKTKRFGCETYKNPELVEGLEELSPVSPLWSMLDAYEDLLFKDGRYITTASGLFTQIKLMENETLMNTIARDARTFGKLLSLAASHDEDRPPGEPRRIQRLGNSKTREGGHGSGNMEYEILGPGVTGFAHMPRLKESGPKNVEPRAKKPAPPASVKVVS